MTKRNHLLFYSIYIEFFCFFVNITYKRSCQSTLIQKKSVLP